MRIRISMTVPADVMTSTKSKLLGTSWYSVALLTAGHFLSDFYANFLPPLLPIVITSLGLSLTSSGLLVMVYSMTSNIVQPLCGYLVDKSGYAWIILFTIPVSAIFICFSGISTSLTLLYLCVALSGLASSFFHPLASSLIGKVATSDSKGLAMSIFIGGGNFGFAIAPAVIAYCLVKYGVSSLPFMILPGAVLTLAYFFAGTHKINLVKPTTSASQASYKWYKSRNLIKLNLVMALRSWAQVSLLTFLPVLLTDKGYTTLFAGNMLTLFLLGGAVGGFAGGYAGDKLGHKNCVIGSFMLCVPLLYIFLTSTSLSWATWLILGFCGASFQGSLPSSIVWAQEMLPDNAAMASGMMLGLTFGLGGAGTALTGIIADYLGLTAALMWTILPLSLAIPIAFTIASCNKYEQHIIQNK